LSNSVTNAISSSESTVAQTRSVGGFRFAIAHNILFEPLAPERHVSHICIDRTIINLTAARHDNNANPILARPKHLTCAETWAGNKLTAAVVEVPGLTAWVHSVPLGPGHAGGDVHYVSLCPSCLVSRIALADVSGHGEAVAVVGDKLREIMQRYLRALEQISLMRDLNQAVRQELRDAHYATMLAVGWHSRRGLLVMTNAGHPPPLWYRASRNEWSWLETRRVSEREALVGVPLGLLADVIFDRLVIKPQSGDLIVLYSDGISETMNTAGEELGRHGLIKLARSLDYRSADAFGAQLASGVRAFRGGAEPHDDATIIVIRRNESRVLRVASNGPDLEAGLSFYP
jgi:phosphoserine phosphatase RsbU/P